jgi:hypothetical protein
MATPTGPGVDRFLRHQSHVQSEAGRVASQVDELSNQAELRSDEIARVFDILRGVREHKSGKKEAAQTVGGWWHGRMVKLAPCAWSERSRSCADQASSTPHLQEAERQALRMELQQSPAAGEAWHAPPACRAQQRPCMQPCRHVSRHTRA